MARPATARIASLLDALGLVVFPRIDAIERPMVTTWEECMMLMPRNIQVLIELNRIESNRIKIVEEESRMTPQAFQTKLDKVFLFFGSLESFQIYLDSERLVTSRSLQHWLDSIAVPMDIIIEPSAPQSKSTGGGDPSRIHHSLVIHDEQTQGVSFMSLMGDKSQVAEELRGRVARGASR